MRQTIAIVAICLALTGEGARAENPSANPADRAKILAQAEARLKSIYEKQEYALTPFSGKWLRDSSGYFVLESNKPGSPPELVQYDVSTGKRSILIGDQQLTLPGTSDRLFIQDVVQSPTGQQFLLYGRSSGPSRGNADYWIFDIRTASLKKVPAGIPHQSMGNAFSPTGDQLLFRSGRDLHVCDLAKETVTALTNTKEPDLDNGSQAVWSPDGRLVAFVQTDSSKVRLRPVIQPTDPTYPQVSMQRFARVGTPIPTLRVGVVDKSGGETRWIRLPADPGTFYINDVSWPGNPDEILVELLSRSRDSRQFFLVNQKTGEVATAYKESDPAWVDASTSANAGLEWIRQGKAFVLLSEKDGWRHAYVISRDGKESSLLTKDKNDIIARGPVDEAGGWFYYYASPKNATQRYLYRLPLDGSGDPKRVTPADQPGTHQYDFSPDRKWAFHTRSTFDTPPVTDLVRISDHQSIRVLQANETCRARVRPLITQPTEFLELDIGGGVTMDAWMIKPRDFQPTKKYPVFVFVYGEPHSQTVLDDWAGGQNQTMYHRMIADLGYLVVSIDNRGTPAPKGAAWRRAVYGSLGPLSTEEQAAGLKELARIRPFVDLSRVGIWGWSGGGSNTLNAMFRKPDLYHVGIAVAPKPQPDLYNAWFQEIFMRTREENPKGYQEAAAINFAEGLRGDLLIIHGTGETNTHLSITEGLVDRLIELGKKFEYMAYPNRDHGLREGKGTLVHMRLLMTRYLIEHLPPGPR